MCLQNFALHGRAPAETALMALSFQRLPSCFEFEILILLTINRFDDYHPFP
jgi:hypothetical protein